MTILAPTIKDSLLGITQAALVAVFKEWGQPAYRANQVLEWVFKRRVTSFDQMTNLSLALRTQLAERFTLRSMTQSSVSGSADTTRKFLLRLHDGRYIEVPFGSVPLSAFLPSVFAPLTPSAAICGKWLRL